MDDCPAKYNYRPARGAGVHPEGTDTQNLVGAMRKILGDQEYNLNIRRELQQVKELIGPPGVMARAAKLIAELTAEA